MAADEDHPALIWQAMQSFDSIVKWEMYFAVLAASYLIAYILYFLVNVLDSVRWMRVAVVGYMITTSLHLVVAVAFAWAAHTSCARPQIDIAPHCTPFHPP